MDSLETRQMGDWLVNLGNWLAAMLPASLGAPQATVRGAQITSAAALGAAFLALLAAIIAGMVALRNGYLTVRTTAQIKHADFRQIWINALRDEMTTFQSLAVAKQPWKRRGKPDALLHHSDQGSQYTSEQFQRLMKDNGVTCSMSRSGNCWDNAAMESFFSSLKTERIRKNIYRSRDQARADVFDYIERFIIRHAGTQPWGISAPSTSKHKLV